MRAVILVIDGFGVGALPDAGPYGDAGANTLRSVCRGVRPLGWPNLIRMGLGNAAALVDGPVAGCEPVAHPQAAFGVMRERSTGKDTTTGHWEIAGIVSERGFHVFPPDFPSFPEDLVQRFEAAAGYRILGNRSASGTAIIQELGEQQMAGRRVIAYTSADSVFQIAAHEAVVPPAELYRICEIARSLCDDYRVARVIARPFAGEPGHFYRTAGRHDYSIALPGPSVLDDLLRHGVTTVGVGKIGDIFNNQGVAVSHPDKGNTACLTRIHALLAEGGDVPCLIFANLVDTDMVYGHRRDIRGYHDAVVEIDAALPRITGRLGPADLLIITSDHGCDPGFSGTDHTREHVPLLVCGPETAGRPLGVRQSFADVARSVAEMFGAASAVPGRSFFGA